MYWFLYIMLEDKKQVKKEGNQHSESDSLMLFCFLRVLIDIFTRKRNKILI